MQDIYEEAKSMQAELVRWRRHIHQNPEIGMDLPNTSRFVWDRLVEMGCQPEWVGGCGIKVVIGNQNKGKCILLRADMDALPIQEETGLEYASQNGYMHACGHDLHTAMLLGAARLLKRRESQLNGCVKLMFQPGEEVLRGALAMIEDGILENPKVDAAIMIHCWPGMKAGQVIVSEPGPFTSAGDMIDIHVKGIGGHSSRPHKAVDPVNVIVQIYCALQALWNREIPADEWAVINMSVLKGADRPNIIPEKAYLGGSLRTYNQELREHILQRIEEIAVSVARMYHAQVEPGIITRGANSVVNSADVIALVRPGLEQGLGAAVPPLEKIKHVKMTASEDFGYISSRVPSLMMLVTTGDASEGFAYPAHQTRSAFDDSVLATGASVYAIAAISCLQ